MRLTRLATDYVQTLRVIDESSPDPADPFVIVLFRRQRSSAFSVESAEMPHLGLTSQKCGRLEILFVCIGCLSQAGTVRLRAK